MRSPLPLEVEPPGAGRGRWAAAWREWRQAILVRAPLALRRRETDPGAFGILMYHRIARPMPGEPFPTSTVTPERFRAQLAGLAARGFRPWSLRKVLQARTDGERIPENVFVVTFDDGYANNFTAAWPILRELGMPATIFLATAWLDGDGPFPFEDWPPARARRASPEAWRPLTSDECRAMLADGLIDLGAHTHTHGECLDRPEALEADLRRCVATLAERFGIVEPTFAFPFGKRRRGFAGPAMAAAARAAGAVCALTSESGLVLPGADRFDWPRFTACQGDTAATLAAKLDGRYDRMRRWRRGSRS